MMRIVRKVTRVVDHVTIQEDACIRGPFLTETVMHDGRPRRLVIELHGTELRIRYAKCKQILTCVSYESLVKQERARRWKLAPRSRKVA